MYIEKFPDGAKDILQKLNKNGFEAYLVGGCIRDLLLKIEPKDWDITTNATPDEVESIFNETIPTGKDYGTITVNKSDGFYEVTTYRLESDYDGRRPKAIKYASTLIEDLQRRDFTINAMAIGLDDILIDNFHGKVHLEYGEIHCVGLAKDRIGEDKLRALRAIRFASRYGFTINRDIIAVMDELSIVNLSQERIRDEFNKIIMSETPSIWLKLMANLGLLHQIIPELTKCYNFYQYNPHHDKDVFNHILSVVDAVEPKLELRLSSLFHDIGKPNTFTMGDDNIGHFYQHHKESASICREVMKRMKYSNKEIEYVSELVYHHMSRHEFLRTKNIKKFIYKVGEDKLQDLFKLQLADIASAKPPYDFEVVIRLRIECERLLNLKEPMSVKDLDINGHDLISIGYYGIEIGNKLNELLEHVLEFPEDNNKNILIKLATR